MENCIGLKLKRKEFDDVDDEVFADFCLSSPASKIRRLDADLPPIIEKDSAGIPLKHEQPIPESATSNKKINQMNPVDTEELPFVPENSEKAIDIEELPFVPENSEKAIVLFKPMNQPIFYSPNNLSIDPSLISSFKNHALLRAHNGLAEDEAERNGDNGELNGCKAIIPWASSQPLYQRPILASQTAVSGIMESEDMDATMMEIEDASSTSSVGQQQANEYLKQSAISEGQQPQWQQQHHCMIPQPPQNITTPIVWYR